MLALIQRVTHATVTIEHNRIAEIKHGMLALIGIEKTDGEAQASRLLDKLLSYRMFSDADGKMNFNVQDVQGGLLLVSQFTLVAETNKGNRPGFSTAMLPLESGKLFSYLTEQAKLKHPNVATGIFGAHMQIDLCNDGPVTFLLQAN